ncbi:hypothetical protein [uncultured Gammaproteobacteria bacterium]|jgi:LPS-assembly lipoprotein|nr:hypothetical protein BROOK1789B_203 [Bathymodiolus brooksi thiotrophic gill symbiont]CAC9563064.1 hypothetical protein [uncultured Gammaproteobacteria bacterium]CAC9587024.1 hypothetical protein [uncultured Gammaproteobacteria bacterium]CAC9596760.1 hypothetical protein [uncultured Gammaproteobacteria bacterium]CAC9603698.1 hypothetical protein [uncultured Gammaproteobacteria bacterium]
MSKISLLVAILIFSLLSACGFHTPTKITALNVLITGKVDSVFAIKLKTHFNVEVAQSLVVQIDNEVQKKQTATYSNGVSSSYTLTLSVPVKIFRNKKILLSKTLTASTTIGKLPTTQADRLQIDTNYLQLRNIVVTKLLRRLRYLDEN